MQKKNWGTKIMLKTFIFVMNVIDILRNDL